MSAERRDRQPLVPPASTTAPPPRLTPRARPRREPSCGDSWGFRASRQRALSPRPARSQRPPPMPGVRRAAWRATASRAWRRRAARSTCARPTAWAPASGARRASRKANDRRTGALRPAPRRRSRPERRGPRDDRRRGRLPPAPEPCRPVSRPRRLTPSRRSPLRFRRSSRPEWRRRVPWRRRSRR